MVALRERVEVVPFNKFSPMARLAASVIHEKITHSKAISATILPSKATCSSS